MNPLGTLLYWVREREAIRLKKEVIKSDPPWTKDPILIKYRFCNVRREDDRVTRWIAENIRKPYENHEHLWFMLCMARQLNWPDTLKELIHSWPDAWPSREGFTLEGVGRALRERQKRGDKLFTGAYLIPSGPIKGASRAEYMVKTTFKGLWIDREKISWLLKQKPSLEAVHSQLVQYKAWGNFLAYQAVVDMRFTPLLCDASDVGSWAAAGPGTLRGLNRLARRMVQFNPGQKQALAEMRLLHPVIEREAGVSLDFSDVPNVLCEFDKYARAGGNKGRLKARYVPGRGS